MADREAKLRILTEIVGADKAAAVLAAVNVELKEGGQAAEKASVGLSKAAQATGQLDAAQTEAASSAAQEAGALASVEAAARDAGAATDALRSDTEAAGDAGKAAALEIASGFERAGQSVRESGLALEVQRAGLQAILSEADKLTTRYITMGAEGKEGANAVATATLKLKANLADVNAEIGKEIDRFRKLGTEGDAAFGNISGAALTFGGIAEGATDRVNAAWKSLNEDFKLTPKQIAMVAQAVELLKLEMIEMSERGQAATVEQIAVYEKLEGELTKLTLKTNQLTNAASDNSARLKETGAQVQGVAMGVQQLTAALGPNAAKVGLLVGNIGQLGGAVEGFKDATAAMNLNNIVASNSFATMGTQIAAILGALIAGAAAGGKFSDQTTENAQTIDRMVESLKKWLAVDVSDWTDRFNLDLQKNLAGLTDADTAAESYWNLLKSFPAASTDFIASMLGMTNALDSTGSAQRFQTVATRDGIDAITAEAIAAKNSVAAWKFYEDSRRAGETGQRLWTQAIEASKDGVGEFNRFLKENSAEMAKAVTETGKNTEALKKEADERDRINRLIQEEIQARANLVEQQRASTDATNENVARMIDQNAVTNGATVAIREKLAAIGEDIAQSDLHSVSLARDAAKLQELLDKTDGLTSAQRARIQAVKDLADRANELTDAEQRHGAELIKAIVAGREYVAMLVERKTVTETIAASESASAVAEQLRVETIRTQIELIRDQIQQMERLQGVARQDIAVNMDKGVSIDLLRMREEALSRQVEGGITVWHKEADAKKVSTDAMLSALSHEKIAYDNVSTAATALNTVLENGKTVYTNLTAEQRAHAAEAVETVKAQGKIGDGADALGLKVEALRANLAAATLQMTALMNSSAATEEQLAKTAAAVDKMNESAAKAAEE